MLWVCSQCGEEVQVEVCYYLFADTGLVDSVRHLLGFLDLVFHVTIMLLLLKLVMIMVLKSVVPSRHNAT